MRFHFGGALAYCVWGYVYWISFHSITFIPLGAFLQTEHIWGKLGSVLKYFH